MEEIGTEERKPFDEEIVKDEEETQPEPDEHIMMDQGNGRVWSVKVPKHLMEAWSKVEGDNIELAKIRVYNKDPRTGKQRIVLLVPSNPEAGPDVKDADTDEYEMDMVNEAVENQIVVAEREKAPGSRARTTILTGRIKHDCNLRPVFTEKYRQRMKLRTIKANTPARTIRMIDEVVDGRGAVNILNSGVGPSSSSFLNITKTKPKAAKGAFERFTRMPRNQLLDILFALYREKPRWSAKDLRARTEQPETYLKEVLSEIADLHRSGEFNGLYELKPNFKDTVKSESGDYTGAAAALMQKPEPVDVDMYGDDDDDDDDDDDMEEIS